MGWPGQALKRAALALAAALLSAPAAAHATPVPAAPDFVGLNVQTMLKFTPSTSWAQYLDQLPAGGMQIARIEANWSVVEQNPPVGDKHRYWWKGGMGGDNWSTDAAVAALASRHVRALPVLAGPPTWATLGGATNNNLDYAAYVAAFANRYGVGGTFWASHPDLPALPVLEYEIDNEVNNVGGMNPADYAKLLAVVDPAVHAVQPKAVLLASMGWFGVTPYLDQLWASAGGPHVGGIALHAYGQTAPGSLALVQSVRAELGKLGVPDLPISVTEMGQPAALAGPGAASSAAGMVGDATRAAHQEIVTDALARSDCGVDHVLEYAIIGSETPAEPLSAGYMGVFRKSDGSPTATGAALQDASVRWDAEAVTAGGSPRAGSLGLCSGAATDPAAMLPLDFQPDAPDVANQCVSGRILYQGNPLESAVLTLSVGVRTLPVASDAYGNVRICLPPNFTDASFDLEASVSGIARSERLRCATLGLACTLVGNPPTFWAAPSSANGGGGAPATPPTPTYPNLVDMATYLAALNVGASVKASIGGPICGWKTPIKLGVPLRYRGGAHSTLRVRAAVACRPLARGAKVPFQVLVWSKRAKKPRRIKTIALTNWRGRIFTVRTRFRAGDQLVLVHAADAKSGVPGVSASVLVRPPLAKQRATGAMHVAPTA